MSVGSRAAAIVLTKDGREHLEPGLDALCASRVGGGEIEVVLVDNGSVDGAPAQALRRFPGLRGIRSEANLGFAGGVHLGAKSTDAEILVLVNDDAVVEPGAVAALVEALEGAPPDVVATAGLLTDASGERIDFVDGLVTFDGHAFQRGAGRPVATDSRAGIAGPRLFPCGGLCALRRGAFERLGGFDESFFAYLEDVDFGWRASLAGLTTLFVPGARARHLSGATGRRLGLSRRGVLIEANAFSVAYKNLGEQSLAALLPAILVTFQHRARFGLMAGAPEIRSALSDPFPEMPAARVPGDREVPDTDSFRSALVKLVRRFSGFEEVRPTPLVAGELPFVVEHEAGRMWLRAWNRILTSWPQLVAKRRFVQSLRRVPDSELLARHPLHLVATYPGDEELFSSEFFRALLPKEPELVEMTLDQVGAS